MCGYPERRRFMKEIIMEVSEDGEISIETKGFSGKSCVAESQFLKDVLGREKESQLTPAYWQKGSINIKKYLPLCG
jgi:hypothetical protein